MKTRNRLEIELEHEDVDVICNFRDMVNTLIDIINYNDQGCAYTVVDNGWETIKKFWFIEDLAKLVETLDMFDTQED